MISIREQELAETRQYLKYLLCGIIGIVIGAGATIFAFSITPIKANGLGFNVNNYNSTYTIWDFQTQHEIYSFPVGELPELDSAINHYQKNEPLQHE